MLAVRLETKFFHTIIKYLKIDVREMNESS